MIAIGNVKKRRGLKEPSATPLRSAASAQAAGTVHGGLLELTRDGIVGWARDPAMPHHPVKVILSIDDLPIASAVADRYDLPAVAAQCGFEVAGFVAALPPSVGRARPFDVVVRTVSGQILGEPLTVSDVDDRLPPGATQSYDGMVDYLRDGRLLGWAWNTADPAAEVTVDLFDGSDLLGRTSANLPRDDLKAAGKRGGRCAFCFELPVSLLDMRFHRLRVVLSEANIELPGGPISFGPSIVAPLLRELAELRGEVKRLTSLVDGVAKPDGSFQSGVLQTLLARLDAQAEIQNEAIARHFDRISGIATVRPAVR